MAVRVKDVRVAAVIAIAGVEDAADRAAAQAVVREVMVVAILAAVVGADDAKNSTQYLVVSKYKGAAAMRPFLFGLYAECPPPLELFPKLFSEAEQNLLIFSVTEQFDFRGVEMVLGTAAQARQIEA